MEKKHIKTLEEEGPFEFLRRLKPHMKDALVKDAMMEEAIASAEISMDTPDTENPMKNHCYICGNRIPDGLDTCAQAMYACDGPKTRESNTPDTEKREENEHGNTPKEQFVSDYDKHEEKENDMNLTGKDRQKLYALLGEFEDKIISSRDTYWKERVRKEVEWQPIETAPKDGTHILVINLNTPEWNRVPTVAHWFELSVGDETRGNFFLSWNKNADDADYQMDTITHWKALDTLLDNLK